MKLCPCCVVAAVVLLASCDATQTVEVQPQFGQTSVHPNSWNFVWDLPAQPGHPYSLGGQLFDPSVSGYPQTITLRFGGRPTTFIRHVEAYAWNTNTLCWQVVFPNDATAEDASQFFRENPAPGNCPFLSVMVESVEAAKLSIGASFKW